MSSWFHCHGRGKVKPHNPVYGTANILSDLYVIGTQESAMTEKDWVNFIKKQIVQSTPNINVEMVSTILVHTEYYLRSICFWWYVISFISNDAF